MRFLRNIVTETPLQRKSLNLAQFVYGVLALVVHRSAETCGQLGVLADSTRKLQGVPKELQSSNYVKMVKIGNVISSGTRNLTMRKARNLSLSGGGGISPYSRNDGLLPTLQFSCKEYHSTCGLGKMSAYWRCTV